MRIPEWIRSFFQERFAFLCVLSLCLGSLCGSGVAVLFPAVPWLLGVLMFNSGLGLRLRDLEVLGKKPWLLPLVLLLFHCVFPTIWAGIGNVLGFAPEVVMGFAILVMLPVSATCLVWTSFYRSNVTLGMAILLVDTLVSPFIIPYVLAFLFGASVHMDPFQMLQRLFWMMFFPTVLAILLNRLTHGNLERVAGKPLAIATKFTMLTILWISGATVFPNFSDMTWFHLLLCGTVFLLSALLFLVTFLLGHIVFSRKEDVVALTMCSVRTTTVGIVLSIAYFTPLTTLTIVLNMLFQQPLAALAGKRIMGRQIRIAGSAEEQD